MATQTQFDFTAKARSGDPVTSHAAADRLNAAMRLSQQRLYVLRRLQIFQPCTAKVLDIIGTRNQQGIAHRRMRELVKMGFVRRVKTDDKGRQLKEMLCYLTDKGEQFLREK